MEENIFNRFPIGTRVYHKTFGKGTIICHYTQKEGAGYRCVLFVADEEDDRLHNAGMTDLSWRCRWFGEWVYDWSSEFTIIPEDLSSPTSEPTEDDSSEELFVVGYNWDDRIDMDGEMKPSSLELAKQIAINRYKENPTGRVVILRVHSEIRPSGYDFVPFAEVR